ncbi:hypothetical protein [Nocardia cyriacigeorgica]|uniref:hypothetical protein n=1 Tax=Nocardia cyriacigeorgica TaxID=135487 RepID=UPI001319CDF7|nr:hypothetical protein [Nocardia cyriacigeorgica]
MNPGLRTEPRRMAARTDRRLWARLAPAAILTAACTVTGCTSDRVDDTTKFPGCAREQFEPPFHDVNGCSAEAVLVASVAAIFDYQPSRHRDQRVAFRTARPLMTREFAARAENAALVWAPITNDRWQHWAATGTPITSLVRVAGDDHPADTETTAHRVLTVNLQPSAQPRLDFAVYARAVRAHSGAAWLLAEMGARS